MLTNLSARTYRNKYVYLRKCLPRTHWGEYEVFISWEHCITRHSPRYYRRAPTGRYSCIAQGVSPGLIIGTHLLSPFRGGTSARVLVVVVALYCIYPLGHLRACVSAAPTELFILLFDIYPGFHIGLCPHFTLGYAGVPPLQGYSTTTPRSMQYVALILSLASLGEKKGAVSD